MNLVQHCNLCDHQKTNLREGITCKLTNRKPDFNTICPKIELNKTFENKLKAVNIEYDKIKRKKTLTYIHTGIFMTIGITFFILAYILGTYFLDGVFNSEGPMSIIGLGLLPIGIAYRIIKKHIQDIKFAKSQKERIDTILNKYNIKYTIDIIYGKKIHGTQKIVANLNVSR